MNNFLEKLLNYYNLTNDEYLELIKEVSLNDLEDYHNFSNVEIVTSRILDAIKNKEKIMIYGDYDCDGFMSTSIMVKVLQYLKYSNYGYYIPNRYMDEYGINLERSKQIVEKGYTLVICVDNGVSQYEALNYLKENNVDVIIIDHHEFNELATNFSVMHPFLKTNNLMLPECATYVTFMLSISLLGRVDEYLLTLATLATISDMMPLKSYNRILVKLGLKALNKYRYQVFTLLDNKDEYDELDLSYTISSKINATGRIIQNISINKIVKYFTTDDVDERKNILGFIENNYQTRKEITNIEFEKIDKSNIDNSPVLIENLKDTPEGILGLIATKLLSEYNKPSFVFNQNNEGILKGSARSIEGFPLSELFDLNSDILLTCGGHSLSGGLSLKVDDFDLFKDRVTKLFLSKEIKPKDEKYLELEIDEFTKLNYSLINSLSPFGEGFKRPKISVNLPLKTMFYNNEKKYLKGNINNQATFIAFNVDKLYNKFNIVKLIGYLEISNFNNKLVLKVNKIEEDKK